MEVRARVGPTGLLGRMFLFMAFSAAFAYDEFADENDPRNPCSVHAMNAYRKCILDNPCSCRNCNDDPSDPDWVVRAREPRSCQDISRIFCPLVRCCTACESTNSFYHSCLANQIASIYFGDNHNCQLFICPGAANDFEGECAPTLAPAPGFSHNHGTNQNPCQAEISAFSDCVAQERSCDSCVPSQETELQLSHNSRTCQELNDKVLCPLQTCCPACGEQLEAVASCVDTKWTRLNAGDVCPSTICAFGAVEESPQLNPTREPTESTQGRTSEIIQAQSAGYRAEVAFLSMLASTLMVVFF